MSALVYNRTHADGTGRYVVRGDDGRLHAYEVEGGATFDRGEVTGEGALAWMRQSVYGGSEVHTSSRDILVRAFSRPPVDMSGAGKHSRAGRARKPGSRVGLIKRGR
jgi:hypothetical protein